jgi:hypothetical protein
VAEVRPKRCEVCGEALAERVRVTARTLYCTDDCRWQAARAEKRERRGGGTMSYEEDTAELSIAGTPAESRWFNQSAAF